MRSGRYNPRVQEIDLIRLADKRRATFPKGEGCMASVSLQPQFPSSRIICALRSMPESISSMPMAPSMYCMIRFEASPVSSV